MLKFCAEMHKRHIDIEVDTFFSVTFLGDERKNNTMTGFFFVNLNDVIKLNIIF